MAHDINITGSNTSTHLLTLSDNGTSEVDPSVRVNWNVLDSTIHSIEIIAKSGAENVWSVGPRRHSQPGSKDWMGVIHPRARPRARYPYAIKWEKPKDTFHIHDPLISIKPRPIDHGVKIALMVAGAIAATALAFAFFGKKHRKRSR